MENTKIVKAYCEKTKRYFGLEIKKFGSEWKVVDFIEMSEDAAKMFTSEIKQDVFFTNDNLQACEKCGSRKVGGCDCASKILCRKTKYDFQCIYCKRLKLDYSVARRSGAKKEGETICLSQGQVVKIHYEDDRPLTKIIVGVGWDPERNGNSMDVDSSVVVAGRSGYETVYFSVLEHPSGCVIHHGDNLTGEDRSGNDDDENITVYLNKVPSNRDRLIFVLNIYECKNRHQKLKNVKKMYIRLYDPISKKALVEYKVNSNLENDTALIIGKAYRSGADWLFEAIGKGSRAESISELALEASLKF